MTAPLLKVEGLKVAYGRIEAVRGVDLEVRAGEFVGIIGSNGAGKTSALRAITGVVAPAAGSITFDGEAITGLPSHAVVARGIAMVPEGRQIFADQTVEDNLMLGAYLRIGKDDAGVEADIERVLELFPLLRERLTQLAGSLSGGEQQMLAIARGLLSRPEAAGGRRTVARARAEDPRSPVPGAGRSQSRRPFDPAGRADGRPTRCRSRDRTYVMENGRILMHGEVGRARRRSARARRLSGPPRHQLIALHT